MAAVSYTTPDAPILPMAIGLDAEVQRLQLKLIQELDWLQVSYGKAYRHTEIRSGKKVYLPKVYAGDGEYRDVLPNDNVQAQSFFLAKDPITITEREPIIGTLPLAQSLDCIFWCDLEKISPDKKYRYDNELLRDVVKVFNQQNVLVQRIYTTPEEVFRGFTTDLVKDKVLQQPYAGFRITIEVNIANMLCTPAAYLPADNQLQLRRGGYLLLRS